MSPYNFLLMSGMIERSLLKSLCCLDLHNTTLSCSHPLYLIVIYAPLLFLLGVLCWCFSFTSSSSLWTLLFLFPASLLASFAIYRLVTPNFVLIVAPWALDVEMYSIAYRISSPTCPIETSMSTLRTLSLPLVPFLILCYPDLPHFPRKKIIGNILGGLPGRSRPNPEFLPPNPALSDSVCCD